MLFKLLSSGSIAFKELCKDESVDDTETVLAIHTSDNTFAVFELFELVSDSDDKHLLSTQLIFSVSKLKKKQKKINNKY